MTATNTGNADLIISSITLIGANPGDYTRSLNNCTTVVSGASCTVTVNFVPTVAGLRTATVLFTDNAPASPQSQAITGTGFLGAPVITLALSSIDFGNQIVTTTSNPVTFTLSNTGTATATVAITSSGDFSVTDSCGGSIAANGNCSAQVTFSPQQLCGQYDPNDPATCISNVHHGSVTVTSNAANSPQTVSLQGTAQPIPPPPGPVRVTMGGHLVVSGHLVVGPFHGIIPPPPGCTGGYGLDPYGQCPYGQ